MTDQAGTPTRARIENLLWQHLEIIEVSHPGAPAGVHASPVPDIGGINAAAKVIAVEIDNLTARLGAQVDLTIETEKQLGIVRVTRDDYLRRLTEAELEKRQPKREKSLNERGVIALEQIAVSLSMPVGRTMRDAMDEAGDDLNIAAVKATDLFTGKPF